MAPRSQMTCLGWKEIQRQHLADREMRGACPTLHKTRRTDRAEGSRHPKGCSHRSKTAISSLKRSLCFPFSPPHLGPVYSSGLSSASQTGSYTMSSMVPTT
ncbi:hypothetical protein ARMGADRAFT_574659 [Armillaria gallica]|uniref:Uncharacterized protein n=1 Tax=Armillaria gallica TaxID=47427 RepID=A0A2H3DT08_ARMGA|nr:hypothetical protein ARMGADRAFT_574659 [Armillaria gallica]